MTQANGFKFSVVKFYVQNISVAPLEITIKPALNMLIFSGPLNIAIRLLQKRGV